MDEAGEEELMSDEEIKEFMKEFTSSPKKFKEKKKLGKVYEKQYKS